MFDVDERVALIEQAVDGLARVTVEKHAGLAIQAAAAAGADFVVKGLRTTRGFRDRAADGPHEPFGFRDAHGLRAGASRPGIRE